MDCEAGRGRVVEEEPALEIEAHEDAVTAVSVSVQHDLLATASRDGTARLWRLSTGGLVRDLSFGYEKRDRLGDTALCHGVSWIGISCAGYVVAYVPGTCTLYGFTAAGTPVEPCPVTVQPGKLFLSFCFSLDGHYLFAGGACGSSPSAPCRVGGTVALIHLHTMAHLLDVGHAATLLTVPPAVEQPVGPPSPHTTPAAATTAVGGGSEASNSPRGRVPPTGSAPPAELDAAPRQRVVRLMDSPVTALAVSPLEEHLVIGLASGHIRIREPLGATHPTLHERHEEADQMWKRTHSSKARMAEELIDKF